LVRAEHNRVTFFDTRLEPVQDIALRQRVQALPWFVQEAHTRRSIRTPRIRVGCLLENRVEGFEQGVDFFEGADARVGT
jgi:hypothetical protein